MMRCTIKRDFAFSTDGLNSIQAREGETRDDIPGDLVAGLEAEGYLAVERVKDAGASAENKDAGAAPENKVTAKPRRKGRKAS